MDYTELSSFFIISILSIYTCIDPAIFQANVEESLWQSLEEDIIPSVSKSNWLDLQSKVLPKKYKESNVCIAGGMKVMLHSS